VVEADGLTVRLPEGWTVPTPLSIATLVAFEEFQERVVDCPVSIAEGEVLREIVGDGGGGGGGGGGSVFATGGGGATFLAQPVPEITKTSTTIAITSSA
jgi:hypothetical protein